MPSRYDLSYDPWTGKVIEIPANMIALDNSVERRKAARDREGDPGVGMLRGLGRLFGYGRSTGMYTLNGLAAGFGAVELKLPLPTSYAANLNFQPGARPLPAPDRNQLVARASIASRAQVVAYARNGYAASMKNAAKDPSIQPAWKSVAEAYAFVHDLDEWLRKETIDTGGDASPKAVVDDLKWKLKFADDAANKAPKLGTISSAQRSVETITPSPGASASVRAASFGLGSSIPLLLGIAVLGYVLFMPKNSV